LIGLVVVSLVLAFASVVGLAVWITVYCIKKRRKKEHRGERNGTAGGGEKNEKNGMVGGEKNGNRSKVHVSSQPGNNTQNKTGASSQARAPSSSSNLRQKQQRVTSSHSPQQKPIEPNHLSQASYALGTTPPPTALHAYQDYQRLDTSDSHSRNESLCWVFFFLLFFFFFVIFFFFLLFCY
jgi:hypothetical protein